MNLSPRLRAVAELAGTCRGLADIGSDHAFLPVWLVKNSRAGFAVAGEISPGPLEAARRTIREEAMENAVRARLGDGLSTVTPGEVEVVTVAGMGGREIRDILMRSPEVTTLLRRIVCQPMSGAPELRRWLSGNGWRIVAETLALDGGRIYEVLAAEHGRAEPVEDLLLEIGPLLWRDRHPLLASHIDRIRAGYQQRVDGMANSQSPAVTARRLSFERRISELEAKLTCLQAVE